MSLPRRYGDDLNLWYVALTRAKKRLSLPPRFQELVQAYSKICDFANPCDSSSSNLNYA